MADTLRYWDGQSWTDHIQAKAPVPAGRQLPSGAPSTRAPSTAYAWSLALLPLLDAASYYVLPVFSVSAASTLLIIAAGTALAFADRAELGKRGVHVPWWTCLVFPVHLVIRTRRAGSTPAIPIAWVVAFAVSLAASSASPGVYDISADDLTSEISTWLAEQGYDPDGLSCEVPDGGVPVGTTLRCYGATDVEVVVADDGSISWEVQ